MALRRAIGLQRTPFPHPIEPSLSQTPFARPWKGADASGSQSGPKRLPAISGGIRGVRAGLQPTPVNGPGLGCFSLFGVRLFGSLPSHGRSLPFWPPERKQKESAYHRPTGPGTMFIHGHQHLSRETVAGPTQVSRLFNWLKLRLQVDTVCAFEDHCLPSEIPPAAALLPV